MVTVDRRINIVSTVTFYFYFLTNVFQLVSLQPESEASTKDGWLGANRKFAPQTEGVLDHSDLEVDMMSDVEDETASDSSKGWLT